MQTVGALLSLFENAPRESPNDLKLPIKIMSYEAKYKLGLSPYDIYLLY